MIIRILGEGQYQLPDEAALAEVNTADDAIQTAVAADDAAGLAAALGHLRGLVTSLGSPLADDDLRSSDVIVPGPDASLAEVRALLSDDGLVPDVW